MRGRPTGTKKRRTPGDSKQHRLVSLVELLHEASPLVGQPEPARLKRFTASTGLVKEGVASAEPASAPRARVAASIVQGREAGREEQRVGCY